MFDPVMILIHSSALKGDDLLRELKAVFGIEVIRVVVIGRVGFKRNVFILIEVHGLFHFINQFRTYAVLLIRGIDADREHLDIFLFTRMRIGFAQCGKHLKKDRRIL